MGIMVTLTVNNFLPQEIIKGVKIKKYSTNILSLKQNIEILKNLGIDYINLLFLIYD